MHELKKFRCILFELFSEQNSFFSNKTELLGLHMKEDIAAKDKASVLLFKDFLLKRLQVMEHQVESFIEGEFDSVKDIICNKTKEIGCELNNILCQTKDIESEIGCIIDMFSTYVTELSNYYFESNPALSQALFSISQAALRCKVAGTPCDTVVP